MAHYAIRTCRYRGELVLEGHSRSTWENIRNAIPLIENADRIKIVSHPLHGEKGRAYLAKLRPDLAARHVPAADYRLGEWTMLKPALAIAGMWDLRRNDRTSS